MKASEIRKTLKSLIWSKKFIQYFITNLLCLYVLIGYMDNAVEIYDLYILEPYISQIQCNGISAILVVCAVVKSINIVVKRYRSLYKYNSYLAIAALWLSIILLYYWMKGRYVYRCIIVSVTYVDAFVLMLSVYFIAAMVNSFRTMFKNDKNSIVANDLLIDWPITKLQEDILDYGDEPNQLVDKLLHLDPMRAWSFAITAPWGAGKTSFLNLVEDNLREKNIEIIKFNPRNSKSVSHIQEDFFNVLASVLSRYDSRCNKTFKDYMSSLMLIDNRGVIEKALNMYHIWDKESLKEKLQQVFARLDKRVIIIIDDFDRLSKDEIFELLKLIDSNAAFHNLIFLTAFDKVQVNKSLGIATQTEDAYFVDKFFDMELSIPVRPYTYILKFLTKELTQRIKDEAGDRNAIAAILQKRERLLQEYLPTLRDVKRFINLILMDFVYVQGEVNYDDYILLHLIKYKYPEEFKRLYRKEYIYVPTALCGNPELYCLKEDVSKDNPIFSVLTELFPTEKDFRMYQYRRIYERQSFDFYFINKIHGALKLSEMTELFCMSAADCNKQLDTWCISDNYTNDMITNLYAHDENRLGSWQQFLKFTDIVIRVALNRPNSRAYWLLLRLITLTNVEKYQHTYSQKQDDYKAHVLNLLLNDTCDKNLTLLRNIHSNIKIGRIDEDEIIIKDSDIFPYIKNQFAEYLNDRTNSYESRIDYLYSCVDHVASVNRLIMLDKKACSMFKDYITSSPHEYIHNFVRLSAVSSSVEWNGITGEPFASQIFGSYEAVEQFIVTCKDSNIHKADVVYRFWQIYKANGYKSIQFENQGNVQTKIDKGLKSEYVELQELMSIQKELGKIMEGSDEITDETFFAQQENISQLQSKVQKNHLYIQLHETLSKQLQSFVERLNKENQS